MSNAGATSQVRPLRELLGCQDKPNRRRIAQRGDYWVLYNYVPARRWFRCDESITYTTHADFTFLDNLEPLLDRSVTPDFPCVGMIWCIETYRTNVPCSVPMFRSSFGSNDAE
jgi:hypothetical protein